MLSEPLYSELTGALQQASTKRKLALRSSALMQADIAAYDIIYGDQFGPTTVSPDAKQNFSIYYGSLSANLC